MFIRSSRNQLLWHGNRFENFVKVDSRGSFLLIDEAKASRAVFVIDPGRTDTLLQPGK